MSKKKEIPELRPCPYCGHKPDIEVKGAGAKAIELTVFCTYCGASLGNGEIIESRIRLYWDRVEEQKNSLVERWNRREEDRCRR